MRKRMLAVILGLLVFSLVAASAASLGVNTARLGAGTELVASCDDAVDVSYTTSYGGGEYLVTEVTVSDIGAGCAGQTLAVTLADGDDDELWDGSDTVSGTSVVLPVSPGVSAEAVELVAVVISG